MIMRQHKRSKKMRYKLLVSSPRLIFFIKIKTQSINKYGIPFMKRNIEGRSIFECKPSFQGIFLTLKSKKCRLFVPFKTQFIRAKKKCFFKELDV